MNAPVITDGQFTTMTLPFTIDVTEEQMDNTPDYFGAKGADFPFCPVMIDGEYWIMFKNGYTGSEGGDAVYRYKGTNIENAVRQPDGVGSMPQGMYILGGLWYNQQEKKLYAPLHVENHGIFTTEPYHILREIHLATSIDKGLSWTYEGPILTDNLPGTPRRTNSDYTGKIHSGGDGDHLIYVDARDGYIYIFTDHYTWGGAQFLRHCVARCAIADKMAPGKWWKFYNGSWSEPGLGGKGSYVNGYCVTYNEYLKKYLSLNYLGGISMCDDLATQDWSPSFHVGRFWGVTHLFAFWPTNEEKNDTSHSGEHFYVYGIWMGASGKRFRVSLCPGETTPTLGFTTPSIWFTVRENEPNEIISMNPGHLYDLEPFPESDDPVEARNTRSIECEDPAIQYAGTWAKSLNPDSIQGQTQSSNECGASIDFCFHGKDIYWRALAGPDLGQADVYLDGVLHTTVDCWASHPLCYQFAFVKRGLDGAGPHTIKIVLTGEKNALSSGTAITHMAFEVLIDNML